MTADKQLNDLAVALPQRSTPKPLARNYLADLIGVNLRHVLETYQWDDLRPLTVDGVTVAGFRDPTSSAKPNE